MVSLFWSCKRLAIKCGACRRWFFDYHQSGMPRARIGTSGWAYDEWGPTFYAQCPRARWLERYAQAFDAVEVNATFYHLLSRSTFVHWREQTPANFRFAIKASRYLTHILRIDFPLASLARQRDAARLRKRLSGNAPR